MTRRRIATAAGALFLTALLAAGCGPVPQDATPLACPAALLEGELLADDVDGFIVRHEEGFVTPIVWPDGYAVRGGDARELIGPDGQVVAREGDLVALGGGMSPDDAAFIVCGEFTVEPRE